MNKIKKKVNLGVYGIIGLDIIITDDVNQVLKEEKYDDIASAIVFTYREYSLVEMILPYDATQGTISHESFHATMGVFEILGEGIDYDHQEPFAYLLEFIHNKVNDAIQTFNKKFK